MNISFLNTFTIGIWLLVSWAGVSAQIFDPERQNMMQPVYMDSAHNNNNFYDFSWNTAALLNNSRSTTFLLGYNSNHTSGAYHLPFEASAQHYHDFFFWSIYPLSENDLFKGYFGYNHHLDKDVLWNDQSHMVDTNPFLLGDSSQGMFEKNGLYWAAEWAHKFDKHWQLGFGFFYTVDQRIKDVFPKPLNKHRDYILNLSTQYSEEYYSLGLTYIYKSQQERVQISRYNLNQNQTPIIYKFRYSDLPVILRGSTSEEREMINYGHQVIFQALIQNSNFTAIYDVSAGISKNETFDGGTRRSPQGEFETRQLQSKFRFDYNGLFFLEYRYDNRCLDATHPDFPGIDVIKRRLNTQYGTVGTKFHLFGNVDCFSDLIYINHLDNMKDLMTENLWEFRSHTAGLRLGFNLNLTQRLEWHSWLGYSFHSVYDEQTTNHGYTNFFDILYNDKLAVYLSPDRSGILGIKLLYQYRPLLDIEFSGFYIKNISTLENYRKNWLFLSWFKLYIF